MSLSHPLSLFVYNIYIYIYTVGLLRNHQILVRVSVFLSRRSGSRTKEQASNMRERCGNVIAEDALAKGELFIASRPN